MTIASISIGFDLTQCACAHAMSNRLIKNMLYMYIQGEMPFCPPRTPMHALISSLRPVHIGPTASRASFLICKEALEILRYDDDDNDDDEETVEDDDDFFAHRHNTGRGVHPSKPMMHIAYSL